ncbi:MAG: hypothetical protein AB7D42_01015 [Candidatus Methanomethylophilaceae archaeon]
MLCLIACIKVAYTAREHMGKYGGWKPFLTIAVAGLIIGIAATATANDPDFINNVCLVILVECASLIVAASIPSLRNWGDSER